jgi:G:T-mismatch repair DNA endonuclease (very short patch repair protein)
MSGTKLGGAKVWEARHRNGTDKTGKSWNKGLTIATDPRLVNQGWSRGLTKDMDIRVAQTAKKISLKTKGRKKTENHKDNISKSLKDRKITWGSKISASRIGITTIRKGKPATLETCKALEKGRKTIIENKKKWVPPVALSELKDLGFKNTKIAEKYCVSCHVAIRWLKWYGVYSPIDPHSLDHMKYMAKRASETWTPEKSLRLIKTISRNGPNVPESIVKEILDKNYPGKYEYIGNGRYVIGIYCPDFIYYKKNKIIEVFGDYWHRNSNPQKRIDYFASFGFECLIIWEKEIKTNIESVTEKIKNFN